MKRVLIFYCLWISAASYADWIVRTDFQIREYLRDHGVFRDDEEIIESLVREAEQGSIKAQFRLGSMFENGEEVFQNYVEAIKWYEMAAVRGSPFAQFNLGFIHEHGLGEVPRDYVEAVKWYKMAAARDSPHARFRLGFMYEQGLGVPKNKSKAFRLYRKADAQGSFPARDRLELMLITAGVKHDTSHANRRRRCGKSLRKR